MADVSEVGVYILIGLILIGYLYYIFSNIAKMGVENMVLKAEVRYLRRKLGYKEEE